METTGEETSGSGANGTEAETRLSRLVGRFAAWVAGVALVALSAAILYGVVLRAAKITDTWSYDFDVFVMVWFGMIGAAYTAYLNSHVTAGIALERYWERAANALRLARFALTSLYLLALVFFGIFLTWQAYTSHSRTFDLAMWPNWVPLFAVPVGAAAWLVVSLGRFVEGLRKQ